MILSNSNLVSYTKLSPNYTAGRVNFTRITPHCVVGQLTVETIGSIFAPRSRKASSNYGIGKDGRVGQYVDEKNRSWCTSSAANDTRAITIECACDLTSPYTMNDKVYNTLINLCVDICKRHGKNKLLWLGSKSASLNYTPKSDEMILTAHRWFSNTACPGDWLYRHEAELAERVTLILSGMIVPAGKPQQEIVVEDTLDTDGLVGYKTIAKWQKIMGTPIDGEISGQKRSLRRYHLAFTKAGIWYADGGSMLIEAVQKAVGLTGDDVDGQLGPITIKNIQERVGADPDGYFGEKTARALQEKLNTGSF
jgi:hypothetical protein